MSGNPDELKLIHASGSPALAVDENVMEKMKRFGLHLEGLATKLSGVEVMPSNGKIRTALEADSTQSGYRYVDAEGKTVVNVKESASQHVRMLLRFDDGQWRIWEVTAAR